MVQSPAAQPDLFWTASFATPRRTVLGALAHLSRLELPPEQERAFLISSGIAPIAYDEPDIPISFEQQLSVFTHIIDVLPERWTVESYAAEVGSNAGLLSFGVLGLAALHAPNMFEAVRVLRDYPELAWGTTRIVMVAEESRLVQHYSIELPALKTESSLEALRRYCLTVDVLASVRMNQDMVGSGHPPIGIWLPYPEPSDHRAMTQRLPCPVHFDAPEARVAYDQSLIAATPLLANPLGFKAYEKMSKHLAEQLRTDVPLDEQVRRLLWMQTPPLDRDSVASMLALAPRTLARKLADAGTSYAELQREVRQARAEEYLRSRALQLSEIADRLGFSDATAFSRAFRSWHGVTPSAWRAEQHRVC